MESSDSVTSASVLARIRENDRDEQAWRDFVARYGQRIYAWCRKRNLQPPDAEDVTQDVLVKLARRLGNLDYDARLTFRGWLRRVTENAITDFFREHNRLQQVGADAVAGLSSVEARQDLKERLEEAFDLELLDLAQARVRSRVGETRWKAWELTAIQQQSGEEVAAQLQMKLPTVYSNRSKVQKMISDELELLREGIAADALNRQT